MSGESDAFLSYTRLDDEFFGGAISSFRKLLELGVKVVTGNRAFNIFQDIDGIEFGEQWQKKLDHAIDNTSFLIPIVTPLYFSSDGCRDELEKFIGHERELGRDDLILPVYFYTAPVLEKADALAADKLAKEVSKRQRYDWRTNATRPIDAPETRKGVLDLSEKIAQAMERSPSPMESAPTSKLETVRAARASEEATLETASRSIRAEETPPVRPRTQRTILWVDDNPANNIYERKAFEAYGVRFELAISTTEALTKLSSMRFDAIISDMSRPPDDRAGYTLLDTLRGRGDLTPYFIYAGPVASHPKHVKLAISKGAQGSTSLPSRLVADVVRVLQGD